MRPTLVVTTILIAVTACSDESYPYFWGDLDGSGGLDTETDVAGDVALDANDTGARDTGESDATSDATDTELDTDTDAADDTTTDTGLDAGPDGEADTASDTGCVPECGDRECGLDPVCGESCGECGSGESCDEGGSCSCGAGYAECGACTNIMSTASCGTECSACAADQWCDGRGCLAARDGDLRIDGSTSALLIYHDGSWRGVCDDVFGPADGRVACRQLGGTYVSHEIAATGPTGDFWMDDVACSGEESRLDECPFPGWGTENCAPSEHVALVCEPTDRTPRECDAGAAAGTVLNEILFDVTGTDGVGDGEFVELFGPADAPVGGWSIEHINGSNGERLWTWTLPPGETLGSRGFYAVGGPLIAEADLVRTGPVQNGPDSLVLYDCTGRRVDAVAYAEFTTSFAVGEGDPATDTPEGTSIGRHPDGADTDDNAFDFYLLTPTPGTFNGSF